MRVLVTGAAGQVGRLLKRTVPAGVTLAAVTRAELDITDLAAVRETLWQFKPEVIISTAAYTAVDRAEVEPDLAIAINAVGPLYLAETAREIPGCRVIDVSTNYVFNGQSARPYLPHDPTEPLCVYGRSKRDGEMAVLETLGDRAIVVRTAWVYAAEGNNFLNTMLRIMSKSGAVRVVADQVGTPTAARPLCKVLWRFAERGDLTGIFHWTDSGKASWHDFAVAIAQEASHRSLLHREISVTAITSEEFPVKARRPGYSVLDSSSTMSALKIVPNHWRYELQSVLDELTRRSAYEDDL